MADYQLKEMRMEVCETCHKKDTNSTKCKRNMAEHFPYENNRMVGECMICGKERQLWLCPNYGGYNVRESERRKKKK